MTRPFALALAGACALITGMGIGRFAYTPLLPYMQRDIDLSIAAAGYIASANFLGYLIGALLAIQVPPARRSRWLAAALLVSAATTLAMALFESSWLLGAVRVLGGMASAFVLIHGSAIALDAFARSGRPGLYSLMAAGVGIGIAATAMLVESMSQADASSTTMWLILGAIATLVAIPALALRDPPAARAAAGQAPDAAPGQAPSADERSALGWLTAAYGLLGFGYVITATFLVVIVRGNPDWRPWEMTVWMCVGLAGAPSNYVWLRIAQLTDTYRAMIAAFLLEAIGVLAAVSGSSLALVMLGAALLGGTFIAITALGLTTGRILARGESGPVVARMTAAFGLGQIIGPGLGGWLAERTGDFIWPSLLAAAALVAGAAMVARARQLDTERSLKSA